MFGGCLLVCSRPKSALSYLLYLSKIFHPCLHIGSPNAPVAPALFGRHCLGSLRWSWWRPFDTALIPGAPPTSAAAGPYLVSCFERIPHPFLAANILFRAEWLARKLIPFVVQETPLGKSSEVPHHVAPLSQKSLFTNVVPIHTGISRICPSPCIFWTLVPVRSKLGTNMDTLVLFGVISEL